MAASSIAKQEKAAFSTASTDAGRAQAKSANKQHSDYAVQSDWATIYGKKESPLDLYKQNFRILARSSGQTYDLSKVCTELLWTDQGTDNWGVTGTMPINEPLTGTVTLSKPNLLQYSKLVPPFLSATINSEGHTDRQGALGVVVIAEVGYGNTWTPVWAMRCVPGDGTEAESVELEDGTWTLNLADDTYWIDQSAYDWKFTKGVKSRKQGWRAHEIAAAVCKQFDIPVQSIAQGTSWMSFSQKDTSGISPMTMIMLAYQSETTKTGKTFIVKWGPPTQKFPLGALQIAPLRRNPNLLTFRQQLIDATLTRTQSPDFCTAVDARGTLKQAKGKHKQIRHIYRSDQAVRRFGYVQKIIPFGAVSSALELKVLAQRALATRLTPIRTAELINPGVATIRRGDAIRINLPEEGYARINLAVDGTPALPPDPNGRNKYTAEQLHNAQLADPTLFGLPTSKTVNSLSSDTNTDDALFGVDAPAVLPVADQGIAFVEYVQHTVTVGSYQVDIQTGFTDMLDPALIQQEIDSAVRAAKAKTAQAVAAKATAATNANSKNYTPPSSSGPSSTPSNPSQGGTAYVQPIDLALTLERTDEGVDFGGAGNLRAIGDCKVITYSDSGWFGGFGNTLIYQILNGSKSGSFVYYAEGVVKAGGITVGNTYPAGTILCQATGTGQYGIECGWAAGTGTIGTPLTPYNGNPDGTPMPGGIDFGNFIGSLGYPYHTITDITPGG